MEDGFEFAYDNGTVTVTATMNGNAADVKTEGSGLQWNQEVTYIFACEAKEISTITLYDLDEPKGGKAPDTAVTAAYPEYYTVESVTWTDIEGGAVGATFETGVPYQVTIVVKATAQADFTADPTVYIDGTQLGWRNVTVDGDTITIVYAFSKPASAPEVEIYAFLTQPAGGEVFVGEALNIGWKTTFVPTETEIQYWDGEDWDQWDMQYPESQQDDYDFENVEAETLRFRVAARVDAETVILSNEFSVTWKHTASAAWSGSSCTVTLEQEETGVDVIVVSYDDSGKMENVVYLTVDDPSAIVTGAKIKVFYLKDDTYAPVRKNAEIDKP